MEIALPPLAQAVHDTRLIETRPVKRLFDTMNAGIGLTYGTNEEVVKIASRINQFHKVANGYLEEAVGMHPAGERYDAQDPKLMAWVAATIIDSTIVGHELLIKPLSTERKDTYVYEAKKLFELLNFDPTQLPDTYSGIVDYENEQIASGWVQVGDLARKLAPYMTLSHNFPWSVAMHRIKRLTVYSLPEELRKQFGYQMPEWEKKEIEDEAATTRATVPYLPPYVKYFKQYRDAMRKLD